MRAATFLLVALTAGSVCFSQRVKAEAAAPQRIAGDDLGYRIGQIDAKIDGISGAIKDLRDLVLKVQQEQVAQGNRITDLERQAKVGGFVLAALFAAVVGQLITWYFKSKPDVSATTAASGTAARGRSVAELLREAESLSERGATLWKNDTEAHARTIRMAQALIDEYVHRDADDPNRENLLQALFLAIRPSPRSRDLDASAGT